ncbi:MAG: hypothetical protein KDA81_05970, partial [Planctomycetaceae bacterium]|nr:hypothetical protein [Planctomycetaceae bacterium]
MGRRGIVIVAVTESPTANRFSTPKALCRKMSLYDQNLSGLNAAGSSTNWGTNPSRITSRTSGNLPSGDGSDRQITFWGVLDAFRRRWIPSLAIAIPSALLVAGLLWQMIPAEYESTALLKIHQYEQRVANTNTSERPSDFLTYRNSQINFL